MEEKTAHIGLDMGSMPMGGTYLAVLLQEHT